MPGGEIAYNALLEFHNGNDTGFQGIKVIRRKGFLLMPAKTYLYAFIFLNLDDIKDFDTAKHKIHHLTWHAMQLAQAYLNDEKDKIETDGKLIYRKHEVMDEAQENLMADVFSALMITLQGDKSFHDKISNESIVKTLTMNIGTVPETDPFPVAMDTLKLIYDDISAYFNPSSHVINQAISLAEEVGDTHDIETSVRQWWVFALAAQQMAWMGFNSETILATAIYTSEDPYVRAIAQQVADHLGIDPKPVSDLQNYNPFTDDEANVRMHRRICEKTIDEMMVDTASPALPYRIQNLIRKQNFQLMSGKPFGWCAPALYCIMEKVSAQKERAEIDVAALRIEALKTLDIISWRKLHKLNLVVLRALREGYKLNCSGFLKLTDAYDGFKPVRLVFQNLPPYGTADPIQDKDTQDPIYAQTMAILQPNENDDEAAQG